jgi:hypothetical protein
MLITESDMQKYACCHKHRLAGAYRQMDKVELRGMFNS